MRHLGSLLAALVVAPVAWVLLAFGQGDLHAAWETRETVAPWPENVAVLAAAGLLLGLLASTRISPVGPFVAGAAYTGYGIGALWRRDLHDLVPDTLAFAGREADLHRPVFTGTGVVVGVLLLVAMLSVRRWQRWPKRPAAAPVTTGGATTGPDAAETAETAVAAEEEPLVREPERTAVLRPEPEPEPEPTRTAAPPPRRSVSESEPEPEPLPDTSAPAVATPAPRTAPEPPAVAAPAPRTAPEPPAQPRPPTNSPWSAPPRQAPR